MTAKILSDKDVLHRGETRGVVVTRVQEIEVGDTRFTVRYWSNFDTGNLHHIESVPHQ